MIQSFSIKLERVKLRGRLKLLPLEVMDVKLGRSIQYLIISVLPFIFNEQSSISFPQSAA